MPNEQPKSDLHQIVELLHRHDVEFLVIGGQAEALFGGTRVTYDTDLCYRRTAHAESYVTRDLTVKTISLDDLIRVKEHIRRPKDRDSLFQLQAIKQLRQKS